MQSDNNENLSDMITLFSSLVGSQEVRPTKTFFAPLAGTRKNFIFHLCFSSRVVELV